MKNYSFDYQTQKEFLSYVGKDINLANETLKDRLEAILLRTNLRNKDKKVIISQQDIETSPMDTEIEIIGKNIQHYVLEIQKALIHLLKTESEAVVPLSKTNDGKTINSKLGWKEYYDYYRILVDYFNNQEFIGKKRIEHSKSYDTTLKFLDIYKETANLQIDLKRCNINRVKLVSVYLSELQQQIFERIKKSHITELEAGYASPLPTNLSSSNTLDEAYAQIVWEEISKTNYEKYVLTDEKEKSKNQFPDSYQFESTEDIEFFFTRRNAFIDRREKSFDILSKDGIDAFLKHTGEQIALKEVKFSVNNSTSSCIKNKAVDLITTLFKKREPSLYAQLKSNPANEELYPELLLALDNLLSELFLPQKPNVIDPLYSLESFPITVLNRIIKDQSKNDAHSAKLLYINTLMDKKRKRAELVEQLASIDNEIADMENSSPEHFYEELYSTCKNQNYLEKLQTLNIESDNNSFFNAMKALFE